MGRRDLFDSVVAPKPARATERRYPAFGAYARPGEDEDSIMGRNGKHGWMKVYAGIREAGPVLPVDHSSGLQQIEALPRGHPPPAFARQESPLKRRNRHVSHFKDEAREGGIGQSLVVVNSELAERFVAGHKLPVIRGSADCGRAYLQVRDDDAVQPELIAGIHCCLFSSFSSR